MSFRDKYTDEEWKGILPFTGFHHNKVKEELLEKAAQVIKDRCDNLACYDADKKPLNNDDEVSPFGKVNLWDFSGGMNKDIDVTQIESINYKLAENISVEEMLADRIKKENQPRDVIQNIVDKIHERKISGKQCEVAIISYSDYNALQYLNDLKKNSVWVSGCLLKVHPSINLQDGEIEIY